MHIAVDIMGGESSPIMLFEGVLHAVQSFPELFITVLATSSAVQQISSYNGFQPVLEKFGKHLDLQNVSQIIEMDDDPLTAIRLKKKSSLIVGLELLKEKQVDAFVTSGNTGALIGGATLFIPLLGGIKRPALLANLPTKTGKVSIIDVGGNVRARADHLIQFARMGAAYQHCCLGVEFPKVGLLNVGLESKKGTLELRKAYEGLQNSNLFFIGNVEGRALFDGIADVLITDGFAGNVLLKTAEGVYSFILEELKRVLQTLTLEQKETVYGALRKQFDYEEYMGAIVCGVDGVAIKCHGKTSAKGMFNAIKGARESVRNQYIDRIKETFSAN